MPVARILTSARLVRMNRAINVVVLLCLIVANITQQACYSARLTKWVFSEHWIRTVPWCSDMALSSTGGGFGSWIFQQILTPGTRFLSKVLPGLHPVFLILSYCWTFLSTLANFVKQELYKLPHQIYLFPDRYNINASAQRSLFLRSSLMQALSVSFYMVRGFKFTCMVTSPLKVRTWNTKPDLVSAEWVYRRFNIFGGTFIRYALSFLAVKTVFLWQ